jgi:hypothetical protein
MSALLVFVLFSQQTSIIFVKQIIELVFVRRNADIADVLFTTE